jgi:hypothetical protein
MTEDKAPNKEALDPEVEKEIEKRAHELWEMEGSPEGRLKEYWHRARELIAAEGESSYPPAQSRGNRT